MLSSFPVAVLAGTVFGWLAGLGIGGGSLLMLWLTVVLNTQYTQARSINLMFYLAAAGIVTILRWRKGKLSIRSILPAVVAGCISTAVATLFRDRIDQELIKKAFAVLMLITGIKELFYRPRKAK